MTYQNHPQPRYFALVAVFCFIIVAMGAARLAQQKGITRLFGQGAIALALIAAAANGFSTLNYAAHPRIHVRYGSTAAYQICRSAPQRKAAAGFNQRR